MKEIDLARRVIETADEYHFIAEEQWSAATDVEPVNEETLFEFRRLIRAALLFYARAYLQLNMRETDEGQMLEELFEIVAEDDPEVDEFLEKNRAFDVLDEEGESAYSKIFSVAEAIRSLLLQGSDQLAASLPARFNIGGETPGPNEGSPKTTLRPDEQSSTGQSGHKQNRE